jgi:hypothetical protein
MKLAIIMALLLCGCAVTPPAPPKCDGTARQPINAPRVTGLADSCSERVA